jgi:hypothetical protein
LLGARFALEVLARTKLPWAACYARSGGSLVPIAAFGTGIPVPVLPSAPLATASLHFPIRTTAFGDSIGTGTILVVAAGHDRFFLLPTIPELPEKDMEALALCCATDSGITGGETGSFEPLSEPYEARIVDHGRSRKYLNVSLFLVDVSSTVQLISGSCPHSLPGSFEHEASAFSNKILGTAGKAGMISEGRILCAFYGHGTGDPELVATQTRKALAKAVPLPDPAGIKTGPYLSVLLADTDAELTIRSFIDGLLDS